MNNQNAAIPPSAESSFGLPSSSLATPWRVGVLGLGHAGLFYLERLSLSADIRLVGAFDSDSKRRGLATGSGCPLFDRWDSMLSPNVADALFLVDDFSEEVAKAVLHGGQHLVIDRPWSVSSKVLRSLGELAVNSNRTSTVASPGRWSANFVSATAARRTGRLGNLRSVRLSSCEKRVPGEMSEDGVLREFGYRWLDQLFVLVESNPERVYAKLLSDGEPKQEYGFLAVIDFANGCTAQIEIDTRSRLGFRTGWMIEGSSGSYRNDRLYTEIDDGEIVDEPLIHSNDSNETFISELTKKWSGASTTLPTLADAANVVQVIEALERSAISGEVVQV
ncbi:MAG: Gfo/Idh/MocA family oxidoreductase [Schlesneria sp.]